MRSSSILAKLVTLASIVGIVAATGDVSVSLIGSPTTTISECTASGGCKSVPLPKTTTDIPSTTCKSCQTSTSSPVPTPPTVTPPTVTPPTVTPPTPKGNNHTVTTPTGPPKNSTIYPTGGNRTSTTGSGGGATTKSGSAPTGGSGSGSGGGSGGSSGGAGSSTGTGAPAAATTSSPAGSSGVADRNGASMVAVVVLGSLVWLLG